jgi:hypothetical protein
MAAGKVRPGKGELKPLRSNKRRDNGGRWVLPNYGKRIGVKAPECWPDQTAGAVG